MGSVGTQQRARRAPLRQPQKASRQRVAFNPRQHDFVFSPARFAFYVGGRGAGKTTAGA
jgi:phage terminase large subunit-like protein